MGVFGMEWKGGIYEEGGIIYEGGLYMSLQ